MTNAKTLERVTHTHTHTPILLDAIKNSYSVCFSSIKNRRNLKYSCK